MINLQIPYLWLAEKKVIRGVSWMKHRLTRRSFLALSAAGAGVALSPRWIEAAIAQLTDESRFAVRVGEVAIFGPGGTAVLVTP